MLTKAKIERESFEEWLAKQAEAIGLVNPVYKIAHVEYETGKTTYLVISDDDQVIWYPIGTGKVGNVSHKTYGGCKNE